MKLSLIFLYLITISGVFFGQTPKNHRNDYVKSQTNTSNENPIIKTGSISKLEAEIKRLQFSIDSISNAKNISDKDKDNQIALLRKSLKAKEELVTAQNNDNIATNNLVNYLKKELNSRDSIIAFQNELIVEYSKPNDIVRGKKFTFKNKPYSFDEHIFWIDFDKNNQPIINQEKLKDFRLLLEYVNARKGLKLKLLGPKYENYDYTYTSLTGGNKSMNYSSNYYSEIAKNYLLANFKQFLGLSDKIIVKSEKKNSEKRVSVRIDN